MQIINNGDAREQSISANIWATVAEDWTNIKISEENNYGLFP